MTIAFHAGALADPVLPADADTVLWYLRLDGPQAEAAARCARLGDADYRDLATRPDAPMRAMRRRLARVLAGRVAGVHPDAVSIVRTAIGAPRLEAPAGWFLSLAGAWPHCLVGLSRRPLGVDLEPADALPPPDDCLTEAEIAQLRDRPADRPLFRWLAKEAHAKRFGVASEVEPRDIATDGDEAGYSVTSRHGTTHCRLFRHEQAIAAIAA